MKKYSRKQIVEAIQYWQKQLDESTEKPLTEARDHAIGDAFKSLYKEIAVQLQQEEKEEMASWKQKIAEHQQKMNDIKKRRAEALAKFKETRDQLKAASGIDIEATDDLGDIASAAADFAAEE